MPQPHITHHARQRMATRRISPEAVQAAICHGRRSHVRGALIFALGRRDVAAAARVGLDLEPHNGVQVVCTPDGGTVLTAYRNHDFRSLKPRGRRRRRRP